MQNSRHQSPKMMNISSVCYYLSPLYILLIITTTLSLIQFSSAQQQQQQDEIPCDAGWIYDFTNKVCVSLRYEYFRTDRIESACSQSIGPSVRDVTIFSNGTLKTFEPQNGLVHSASVHKKTAADFLMLASEVLSSSSSSSSSNQNVVISTGGFVMLGDEKSRKEVKIVFQDGSASLNSVTSNYFPLSRAQTESLWSSSSSSSASSSSPIGCLALNKTTSSFTVVPCGSLAPFFCQYTPQEKIQPTTLPPATTSNTSSGSNNTATPSSSTPSPNNQQANFFSYVTTTPYDQGLPCLGGWILDPKTGFCYLMIPAPHLTAFEAEAYCNDFRPGSHLASIVDEDTASFVFKNVVGRARGVPIITGGLFSQSGENGAWQNSLVRWNKIASKTRRNPMWSDNSEPSLDFGCIGLDPSSEKWIAFPCRNSAPFICSYFNVPVPTDAPTLKPTTSSSSSSGDQGDSSASGSGSENNNMPRPPSGAIIKGSCLPGWTRYNSVCTKYFPLAKSYGFGAAPFCSSQFKTEQAATFAEKKASNELEQWPSLFLDGTAVRNQFPSSASNLKEGSSIVKEIVKTHKNTPFDNFDALIGGTFVDYANFGLWNNPYAEWNRTFVTSNINQFSNKLGCLQLVVDPDTKTTFTFTGINCDKQEQGVACSHVAATVKPFTTLPTPPPTTPVPLPERVVGIDKYPSKHFRVSRGSHGCFRLDGAGGSLDNLELLFSTLQDSCDYSNTFGRADGMKSSSPLAFVSEDFTKDNGYFCVTQFPINVVRRGIICVRDASRPRNETSFLKTDLTFETVDSSLFDVSYREVSAPTTSRATNNAEDGKRILPLNVGESGVLTLVGTSILPNIHALRLSDSDECNNPVWTLSENHLIVSRLPKEPDQPRFISAGGRVGLVDLSVEAALDDDGSDSQKQSRPVPQRFVVCIGMYFSPDLHTTVDQGIDEQLSHAAQQKDALFYTATDILVQLPSLFIQVEALQPVHVPSPQSTESQTQGARLITAAPPSGHFDISQFSSPVFAIFGTGLVRGMAIRFVPKDTNCYHEKHVDTVVITFDPSQPIVHGDSYSYTTNTSSSLGSTSQNSQQQQQSSKDNNNNNNNNNKPEILAFHVPTELTDPRADFDLTSAQKRVLTSVQDFPLASYDLCAAMHSGAEYTPSPVTVRVLRRSLSSLNGMSRVRVSQGFEGPMSVGGIRFVSSFTKQSFDDHLKVDISTIGRMRLVFAANCENAKSFYPLPGSFSLDERTENRKTATSAADPLSFAVYESDSTVYLIIPPGYLQYATDSQLNVCLSSDWGKNYRDTGVTIDVAPIDVMFVASQGGFRSLLYGQSADQNGFQVSVARTERSITIPIAGYGLNDQQTILGFQNENDCRFVNQESDLKTLMRRASFASPVYRVGTDRFAAAAWSSYGLKKNSTKKTNQPTLDGPLVPADIEDMSEPGQTFVFTITKENLRAIPTPSARLALCLFQPQAIWPLPLQWTRFSLNVELFRVDAVYKNDVSNNNNNNDDQKLLLRSGEQATLTIRGLGLSGASIIPAADCDKVNTTSIWEDAAPLQVMSDDSSASPENSPVSDRGPWLVSPTPMSRFSFSSWKRGSSGNDFIADDLKMCLRLAGESIFRKTDIKIAMQPLTFQGAKVCDIDSISGKFRHDDVTCDGTPPAAVVADKAFKTQLTSTRTTTMSAQLTGPPSSIPEASLYLELPYVSCGTQGIDPLGINLNSPGEEQKSANNNNAANDVLNDYGIGNNRHSTLTPVINGRFTLSPHQLQKLEPGLYKICYSVLSLTQIARGAETNVYEDFIEATNITFSILPTYPQLFYLNNSLTGVEFYSGISDQIISISGSALEAGMLLRFSADRQCARNNNQEEPTSEILRMPPTSGYFAKFTAKQVSQLKSAASGGITPYRVCLGVSMFDPVKNVAGTRWIVSRLNVYRRDWSFSGITTSASNDESDTNNIIQKDTNTLQLVQSNQETSTSFRVINAINGPMNLDSTPSLLFSPIVVGVRPCIRGAVVPSSFDSKTRSINFKIPAKLTASSGNYYICFQAAPGSTEFVLPSPLPETFAPLPFGVATKLRVIPVDVTKINSISGYDTRTNSAGESEKSNVVIHSYQDQITLAGPGVVEGARIALLPRLPGVTCELFPSWHNMPYSAVFSKVDAKNNKTYFASLFNTMTDPSLLATVDQSLSFVSQQNEWKALVCISSPGSSSFITAKSAPLIIIRSSSSWWITKIRATATSDSTRSILGMNLDDNIENEVKSRRVTVSVADSLDKLEIALRNVESSPSDSAALPSPVTLPLLHIKGFGFSSSPSSDRARFALITRSDVPVSQQNVTATSSNCRIADDKTSTTNNIQIFNMKKVFRVAGTGTDLYLDFESVEDMQKAYQIINSINNKRMNFELCWSGYDEKTSSSSSSSSSSSADTTMGDYYDSASSADSKPSSIWSAVPTSLFLTEEEMLSHHRAPLLFTFAADASSFTSDVTVNADTVKSSLVRFDNVVDATIPCNAEYNVPVVLRADDARIKTGLENGALKLFYRYVSSTATDCGLPATPSEVNQAEYYSTSSSSASTLITLTTSVKPKTSDEIVASSEADEGAKICFAVADAFGSNRFSMKLSPLTRSTACLSGFSKSTQMIEGSPLQATVRGTRGIRPQLEIKFVPRNADCSSKTHFAAALLDTSDSLSIAHLPLLNINNEDTFMICISSDRRNFAAQPQVASTSKSTVQVTSLTAVILKGSDQISDPSAMQSLFDLTQSSTRFYVPHSVSTLHFRLRGLGIKNSVMSLFVADPQTNSCVTQPSQSFSYSIQNSIIDGESAHVVVIPTSALRSDGKPSRLCLAKGHAAPGVVFTASTEFTVVKSMNDDLVQVLSSVAGLRNDFGSPQFQPGKQLETRSSIVASHVLEVSASSQQLSNSNSNLLLSLPDICSVVSFICDPTDKTSTCNIPRSRAVLVPTPTLGGSSEDFCSGIEHNPITSSPIVDGTMLVCPPALKKPQEKYTAAICVQTAIGRYTLLKTVQIRVTSPSFQSAIPLNGDFEHLTSPTNNLIVAPRGSAVVVGLTATAPSASEPQIVRFGTECASSSLSSTVDYDKVFPIQVVSDGKITISAATTSKAKESISLLTSGELPENVWNLLLRFSIPTCISVDGGESFQQLPAINLAVVDDERSRERRFRDISVLSNTAGAVYLQHYRRIVMEGGQAAQVRPSFPDGSEVRISSSCDEFPANTPTFIVLDGSISLLRATTSTPQKGLRLCVRRLNRKFDEDGRPIGIPFDGTTFESTCFLDSGVRLTIVDASVAVVNLQLQHLRAAAPPQTPFVVTLTKNDPLARVPVVFKASKDSDSAGLQWLRRQVLSSRVMVRIGRPCDSSSSNSPNNNNKDFGDVPLDAHGSTSRIFDTATNQFVDAFEAHFSPSFQQVQNAAVRSDSVAMCISLDASGHFVSISTNVQIVDRSQLSPILVPAGAEEQLANLTQLAEVSLEDSFDLPVGAAVIDPCLGEFFADQNPATDIEKKLKLSCDPSQLSPVEFRISQIVSRSTLHGPTNLGYLYDMRLLIPANSIELTSSSSPSSVRSIQTNIKLLDIRATSRRIQENILSSSASSSDSTDKKLSDTQYINTRLTFVRSAPQIWCIGEDYVTHGSVNTQIIFSGAATAGYRIGLSTCRIIPADPLTQRNITSGTTVALVDALTCKDASASADSNSMMLLETGDDGSLVIPKSVSSFVARSTNVQKYHGYKIIPVCNYVNGRILLDSGVYIASTKELSVIEVNEMTRGLIPIGQKTDFRFDLDGPGIRSDKRVFIRFMPVLRTNPRRSCETRVWPNFWEKSNTSANGALDGDKMFIAIGGNVYLSSEDTAMTTTETEISSSDDLRYQVTGRVLCFSTDGIFFKTHPGIAVAVVPPVVRGFFNPKTHEDAPSLVLSRKNLLRGDSRQGEALESAAEKEASASSPAAFVDTNLAFDLESMHDLGWPEKFESSEVNLGPVPPIELFPYASVARNKESLTLVKEEERDATKNAFLSEDLFERRRVTGSLAVEATLPPSSTSNNAGSFDSSSTRISTAPFISALPDRRYTGKLVFTNATSCQHLTRLYEREGDNALSAAKLHFVEEKDSYFVTSSVPISFADSKIVWDDESLESIKKTFDYVGSYRQHLYDIQPGKFRRPGIDPLPKKSENIVTTTLAWRVCSTVDNKNYYSDEDLLRVYSLKSKLKTTGVDALAPFLKETSESDLISIAAENDVVVSRVIINPDSVGFSLSEENANQQEASLILHGATNAQIAANQISQYLDQVSIAIALDCPDHSPDSADCNHETIRRQIAKRSAELIGLMPSGVAIRIWHAPSISPTMRIVTVTIQFSPMKKYSLAHATNVLYKALDTDTRKASCPFLPAKQKWRVLGTVAVDATGRQLVTSKALKWAFIATMLKPVITNGEFSTYNRTAEGRILLSNFQTLFSIGKWTRLSMLPTDVDASEFPPRSAVTSQQTKFPLLRSPDESTHRTSFSGAPTFANGQTYFGIFTVIMLIPSFFIVVGFFAWKSLFSTRAIEDAASVRTKHITKFQMPSRQLEEIISPSAKIAASEKKEREKKEQEIIELSLNGQITRAEMEEMMRRQQEKYSAAESEREEAQKKFMLEDGEWRGVIAEEN